MSELSHAGNSLDPLREPPARAGGSVVGRTPGAGVRSIVQLRRAITREDREQLHREHGLKLNDYLPELSYVESVPPANLAALEADPLVRAVIAFDGRFRTSAEGGPRENFTTPYARARRGRLLEAELFPDADPATAADTLRQRGATDVAVIDDRPYGAPAKLRFRGDEDAAAVDDVRWIEEVGEARLDAGAATVPTPAPAPAPAPTLARGWAEPLWKLGLTGAGEVIGIIDSPVDLGHTWFADPEHPVGPAHRKIVGYRNAGGPGPGAHGTFTAGIAAGDDPAHPGAHADRGVAWAARLSYGNSGDVQDDGVVALLAAAAADGAFVHTNSWHDEPPIQYNRLAADLDAYAWSHEEAVIVASAGNRGELMGPPGTAKNVLSVAAGQGTDATVFGDGAPGPSADGRTKPELMAYGCSIRSTAVGSGDKTLLDREVYGTSAAICASSWATPAVAGLAVLARQYYTGGHHPGGAFVPSGALVRATLLAACRPAGNEPYPDGEGGWGAVRLPELLTAGGFTVRDVRHADGLALGETASLTVDVHGGAPLLVTLVWTDPPGAAGSAQPQRNQLALTVTRPGETDPFAAPGHPGPVQRLFVPAPPPGPWTVTVAASAVHIGSPGQGYALVVTEEG